jgi:hypothetical protein
MTKAILVVAWLLSHAAAQADDLSIACDGVVAGSKTVGATNEGWLSAPTSNPAAVVFTLSGGEARIRLSSILWRSDGDGWFPVSDLEVSESAIKGRVTLSPLTKPRLRIDRISGNIDLSHSPLIGAPFSFSGACVPLDMRRKF